MRFLLLRSFPSHSAIQQGVLLISGQLTPIYRNIPIRFREGNWQGTTSLVRHGMLRTFSRFVLRGLAPIAGHVTRFTEISLTAYALHRGFW